MIDLPVLYFKGDYIPGKSISILIVVISAKGFDSANLIGGWSGGWFILSKYRKIVVYCSHQQWISLYMTIFPINVRFPPTPLLFAVQLLI
ncbi:MAG: hypothetical protein DA394_09180 [Candidatus Arcticimaribacter sp.]|nr:MAG: hypothetical protein DA394_09180 [Candidatus Arcticimaribacter sp.]